MRVYGIDFTSAPRRAKPITCATCTLQGERLTLDGLEGFDDFAGFEQLLRRPAPWVGGFDFPFGLPRELVTALGLPQDWADCASTVAAMSADGWRARLAGFRATRAAGDKEPPRRTDRLSGAQSAMKCVNPPVALMYRAGAARLAAAGLSIQPCRPSADPRIAIETYPGLLARALIGRAPYKSDTRSQQNAAREASRQALIAALRDTLPRLLGLQLRCTPAQLDALQADASGDRLDALLCAIHAAWAWRQPSLAMPADADPLEGWIPWPGLG
jgi:hypothetical protein